MTQPFLFDGWYESNGHTTVARLFLEHLSARLSSGRLSKLNYENSKRDLLRFAAYLEEFEHRHERLPNEDEFVQYVCKFGSGWTRRRVKQLILRCWKWAEAKHLISENPFTWPSDVRFARPRRPHAMAREYTQMLRAASRALRRVLFVLWHTGMRPEEVRELRVGQVFQQEAVIVLEAHKTAGVTQEARIIGLDAPTNRLLATLCNRMTLAQTTAILAERATASIAPERYVFLSPRRKPWTKNGLAKRIQLLRKRLGIQKPLTAYSFRHGMATECDEAQVNQRAIADQLGHTTTNLIAVYSHAAQQRRHMRRVAREMHARRRQVRRLDD